MTKRFGGDWWLPGRGDSPVKGMLEIADTGAMNVELLGRITGEDGGWLSQDESDLERSRVHPLVHGVGRGSNFTLLDFGSLLGWWGAAVSAVCVAVLALGRQRALPRWMGIVSIVLLLPPVAMAVGMGLPGFVGFTMPIWLLAISLGMVFSRTADR